MKKLTVLLLLFCLSLNTFAASGTIQELSNAIDHYQYGMTVEWDQKDPAFLRTLEQNFFTKIQELKASGLQEKEMTEFLLSKLKNQKMVEDLRAKIDLVKTNGKADQVMKEFMKSPKHFGASGASWDGSFLQSETFLIMVGIGLILLAAALPGGNYSCYEYCSDDPYYDPYYDDYYYY